MTFEPRSIRIVAVCVSCIVVFPLFAAGASATLHPKHDNATLMSRPGTNGAALAVVSSETVLELINREHDWLWVLLPRDENGTRRAGWIRVDDVEMVSGELPLVASPTPPGARENGKQLKRAKQKLEKAKRDYNKVVGEPQAASDTSGAPVDQTSSNNP